MKRNDFERRVAIAELLAQPDPPELHRASTLRLEGKPERYGLVQALSAAFVQQKLLALDERRAETARRVILALEQTQIDANRKVEHNATQYPLARNVSSVSRVVALIGASLCGATVIVEQPAEPLASANAAEISCPVGTRSINSLARPW